MLFLLIYFPSGLVERVPQAILGVEEPQTFIANVMPIVLS